MRKKYCKYCKQEMSGRMPRRGAGYTYDPDADQTLTIGAYHCTNKECPYKKEHGYPYSVPIQKVEESKITIINKNDEYFTVTKDSEIILDDKKFLLQSGDRIKLSNGAKNASKK